MKSYHLSTALTGLVTSAMLAAVSQAQVTISDFSNFSLSGTYEQWNAGAFTPGATAFTAVANDFGGGFRNVAVNASGTNTLSIRLNVNAGNVANKFNIILVDGDGTERVYRFDNVAIGNNQTLTKNIAGFLQDNAPGSVPGLNLSNLTAFHIQGTFSNGNPGQVMNMTFDQLSLGVAAFVPDTIINGGFETANGAGWGTTQGTPSYPASGGNPDGNAVVNGTGGFAVLYAFNNTEKTFASLGLAPGDAYQVQMDMQITNGGSSIGGLRLEGPAGYVVESYPTIIGDGSQWATYSINLTVPAAPGQIKFGLRPGPGSIVAFDNVQIVLPAPPAPPAPIQATIIQGNTVDWTAPSAVNRYQLQEAGSESGPWTDVGPAFTGSGVRSVFDATKSPFYQVVESVPTTSESVYNGNFQEADASLTGAQGWEELGFTGPAADSVNAPKRLLTGGRPGPETQCLQIRVQNAAVNAASGKSLVLQDTFNSHGLGEIIPGNTYSFSFWAKQISSGVSYIQQYKVAFLDENSGIVGTTNDVNFTGGPDWMQITRNGLVAPARAKSALIEITGLTGAVDNGSGEVLIDDVSLLSMGFGTPTVLVPAPVVAPVVEVSWPTRTGRNYQVQSSGSLGAWTNFGAVIPGNNSTRAVYDTMIEREFFRVLTLP